MQKLVEDAVEKGLTYQSWFLILVFVLVAGLSVFLRSYLNKKGEQKAHNEIEKQLHVQSVKLISATEEIKGDIAKDLAAFESDLTEKVQVKIEILLPRIEAYKLLWALTYMVRPTRTEAVTDSEKNQIDEEMTKWYYNFGNGIFLSTEAGKLWRQARSSLVTDTDDVIKDKFSSLRTQIKLDVSVYGQEEAETELGS